MKVDRNSVVISLVLENWRLIRALEKVIEHLPISAQARVGAQAKYANTKLTNLLTDVGISLETFDGRAFDASLPVSPINLEDFQGRQELIIRDTIEPAVIFEGRVASVAKVILSEEPHVSRN